MTKSLFGRNSKIAVFFILVFLLFVPPAFSAMNILLQDGFEDGSVLIPGWSYSLEGGVADVTTSNAYDGKYSARFTLTGDKRAEIQSGDALSAVASYDWGKEYWVAYAVNVTQPIDWWGYFNQHHSIPNNRNWSCGGGTNGFTMYEENGIMYLTGSTNADLVNIEPTAAGADWGEEIYHSEPIQYNHWYEVVLHFKYATDSSGFFQIWLDGKQVTDYKGVTTYAIDRCGQPRYPANYQKLGAYANNGSNGQVLYDDFMVVDGTGSYAEISSYFKSAPSAPAATVPPPVNLRLGQ